VSVCGGVCVYVCERERERERERKSLCVRDFFVLSFIILSLSLSLYISSVDYLD